MGVEDERDILKDIAALRIKEKKLSGKVTQGINYGENFWRLERLRKCIDLLNLLIPSSGEQGMTSEGTIIFSRGPEAGRFRKKE